MTCDDTSDFVSTAQAVFATEGPQGLAEAVTRRWTIRQLIGWLAAPDPQVAIWAARCLGIVGQRAVCASLVLLLRADNAAVVAEAERALWMIWVREGSPEGIARLHEANDCLRRGECREAAERLERLVAREPVYAEAHHQLAVARHSLEELDAAERAYLTAIHLNAYHYPALTGLGHVAIARDEYATALGFYQRALAIHPNLAELREVVPDLEQAIARRVVA